MNISAFSAWNLAVRLVKETSFSTSREMRVPLPGASLVHQLLAALEADGRGDEGTQALLTLYEKLAGL